MKDLMENWKVSVVIPNYNGERLLQTHLPSVIEAYKNPINKIVEIIVVDDASKDNSVSILQSKYKEVKIIRHRKNRRFSATVNTGVRMAKGNLILLLNSDVDVDKDVLRDVLSHFSDNKVFGVSLNEDGYTWAKGYFRYGFVVHGPGKKSTSAHQTFWVSGGSGVFRKSYWMKLKGLDEKLYPPFYWEDLDICYRAMKRGWKLVWEPKAKVIHEHESTNKLFKSRYKSRIQERNQLLFVWKNITSSVLIRKHFRYLLSHIIKHPGYIKILLSAIIKLRYVIKFRRIEKKESIVSDESIFSRF